MSGAERTVDDVRLRAGQRATMRWVISDHQVPPFVTILPWMVAQQALNGCGAEVWSDCYIEDLPIAPIAVTLGKIADVLADRGELDEALRIRGEEQLPVYERLGLEALYGLSRKYLAHARARGDGPPFCKPSAKLVLYPVEELEAWLAQRRRVSTCDPGPAG